MMTPRAHSYLISWEPISERMITANITQIQCYATIKKSSGNVKDDFYNLLVATYNKATSLWSWAISTLSWEQIELGSLAQK